jgi:excisionase family DNA binding protein
MLPATTESEINIARAISAARLLNVVDHATTLQYCDEQVCTSVNTNTQSKLLATIARPKLLTIAEVARELNVSRSTTYSLLRCGLLPLRKIGAKSFVLASDLDAFISALPAVNHGRAA